MTFNLYDEAYTVFFYQLIFKLFYFCKFEFTLRKVLMSKFSLKIKTQYFKGTGYNGRKN